MKIKLTTLFIALLFNPVFLFAQYKLINKIPSEVDFSKHLRDWDGFGFNYVETAQTSVYAAEPQEYGGFSLLDEKEKSEIIDLVFGEDGLKVSLLKMFLDPWHQASPDAEFKHEWSAKYMLEFAEKGFATTTSREGDLTIITTLYGPPAWATQQKFFGGRDLDPEMKEALAAYMIDWARFLKKEKKLPLKYLSLHNEGEDWERWPQDGSGEGFFDYNMFWPHEQVNDFLKFMPAMMKEAGLEDVYLTNGEPSNWFRFSAWGCAAGLLDDKEALNNMGIITSHGFYGDLSMQRWYGNHNSSGIDMLREARPGMHAWVTSTSWGKMDVMFMREIYGNIYNSKVNAIIPWAGIQRPAKWEGGDPNPGNAFRVNEDGTYQVQKGYYFYKQASRAGQAGMAVARTYCMDSQVPVIAFASNSTNHPDALIISNWSSKWDKGVHMKIKGTNATKFHAYRTGSGEENYKDLGVIELEDGYLNYKAPIGTVTTFFAED
ncbi:hypothetical protein [Chondrinema litorale]|uniref:hypothetical protein n=1 Tax=Chondrinema litorale TaxID=2994555 RepID=UPI0025436064|nr:hypothetical protein [Chondrinema litorale]UZR99740.1 hypothetical protein OQ292_37690 [Chondrinema litorale]